MGGCQTVLAKKKKPPKDAKKGDAVEGPQKNILILEFRGKMGIKVGGNDEHKRPDRGRFLSA